MQCTKEAALCDHFGSDRKVIAINDDFIHLHLSNCIFVMWSHSVADDFERGLH